MATVDDVDDVVETPVTVVLRKVHEGSPGEGFEAGVELNTPYRRGSASGWYGHTELEAVGRMAMSRLDEAARSADYHVGDLLALRALVSEVLRLAGVDPTRELPSLHQLAERFGREDDEAKRLADDAAFGRLIRDGIDRCEHGRHRRDACSGCGGASHGALTPGTVIGHTISGTRIVVPLVPSADSWLYELPRG
jgi:hypothetical protein